MNYAEEGRLSAGHTMPIAYPSRMAEYERAVKSAIPEPSVQFAEARAQFDGEPKAKQSRYALAVTQLEDWVQMCEKEVFNLTCRLYPVLEPLNVPPCDPDNALADQVPVVAELWALAARVRDVAGLLSDLTCRLVV